MSEEETYKCEKCEKEFDSERGLHIHQGQKHSEEKKKEENSEEKEERPNISSKKQEKKTSKQQINANLRLIATTTFILGFILGSLITIGFYELDINTETEQAYIENWEERIDLEGEPHLGEEDAPVTIVTYEDFFCPFCAAFNNQEIAQEMGGNSALPQIKENYIEEGKVNYYFKNYPVVGGTEPAIAAECVAQQDHDEYWEFHETHFEESEHFRYIMENRPEQYQDEVAEIVEDLDIDMEQYNTCFENEETLEKVRSDTQEAEDLGITGTPGIIVEGHIVEGAQPFEVFEALIEENL